MTYAEALHELYHQLPVFQRSGGPAYKPGLERTLLLLAENGNPHQDLKTVHVAGTNGKGSVSHMTCSVLMAAGYKCGLFTSPHLVDFRERITINGNKIPEDYVIAFVAKNKRHFDTLKPSFFEAVTTLAFCYFRDTGCDIAIIETGMGGRLDSTNVITPVVTAITSIGMDHTQFLGETIEQIAAEKAGIIKPDVPLVTGKIPVAARKVVSAKVADVQCNVVFTADHEQRSYTTDLHGAYQQENLQVVRWICKYLVDHGCSINEVSFAEGLRHVVRNTGLRGRYEVLSENPRVICDAAHNVPGVHALMGAIRDEKFNKLRIVLGMSGDKDIHGVLQEMPKDAYYYFTQASGERSMPAVELSSVAYTLQRKGEIIMLPQHALETAIRASGKEDLVLVTGSFFLLADILA